MRRLHSWHGEAAEHWQGSWGAARLRIYRRITSTNTLALRLADRGAPHGTVVLADEQTAGRGRRGRRWHAPPTAALLLSFVARPRGVSAPGTTPIRVGEIVAAAVRACHGIDARVKWPNDVLAPDGRKLAGILCEGAVDEGGGYIVIGVGVNVAQTTDDFAPDVRATATSLRMATGKDDPSRAALAGEIVQRLLRSERLAEPLTRAERQRIDALHAFHQVAVRIDDGPVATVLGLLDDGALAVLDENGPKTIRSGTLRAAHTAPNASATT